MRRLTALRSVFGLVRGLFAPKAAVGDNRGPARAVPAPPVHELIP